MSFDTPEFAPPYFPHWMCIVREAVKQRGGEPDAADHLHRWVSEHPSFTDVVPRSFYFPASPWIPPGYPGATRLNRTGAFMRDDILASRSSFEAHPLYLTQLVIGICTGCQAPVVERRTGRSLPRRFPTKNRRGAPRGKDSILRSRQERVRPAPLKQRPRVAVHSFLTPLNNNLRCSSLI